MFATRKNIQETDLDFVTMMQGKKYQIYNKNFEFTEDVLTFIHFKDKEICDFLITFINDQTKVETGEH